MDDISNKDNINEMTTDLTKDLQSLNTLRTLKNEIQSNGITEKVQMDIDTLTLTSFKN